MTINQTTPKSAITCPNCGYRKKEMMPTAACQWFYECKSCHITLKPKKGDCCVFCSYGDTSCPMRQASRYLLPK